MSLQLDLSGAQAPKAAPADAPAAPVAAVAAPSEGAAPRAAFSAADVTVRYMLAGNAIVTFESQKTQVHFTYRVQAPKPGKSRGGPVSHFVAVLTGPDTFQYLGCVFQSKFYSHGRNSKIGPDAKSAQAFAWVWKKLSAGVMPEVLEVYHEGRCGRCGRRLTTPESVSSGIGPECAKKMEGGF
jgi:Family of unknown function (DUF6011)